MTPTSTVPSTHPRTWLACLALSATLAVATPLSAQPAPDATATKPQAVQDEDVGVLSPTEPDFVVVNLPTTLRLPLFKGNFRISHRFVGNLREGSFGDQAGDLFGMDLGAVIGFEYRMAVTRRLQVVFHRTSQDRTIQLYGKYDALQQTSSMPMSMSVLASVEGTDNFQDDHAPAIGVVLSRRAGTRFAGYVTPMWVRDPGDPVRHMAFVGVGGRVRVSRAAYVAAEITVPVGGDAAEEPAYGISVEKRVGGHIFSLTITNTFGTTFAQLARGGEPRGLHLGFNLGRKFF